MSAYPDRPVVGVGVVVLRGPLEAPQVLLIRRGKAPRAGSWSLPGGRQKLGEGLRAAAYREVLEETKLQTEIADLLDVVDSITRDDGGLIAYHYSLVDYLAYWQGDPARPGSDAAEAIWVDAADLERFDLWRETERVIALAVSKIDPSRLITAAP